MSTPSDVKSTPRGEAILRSNARLVSDSVRTRSGEVADTIRERTEGQRAKLEQIIGRFDYGPDHQH